MLLVPDDDGQRGKEAQRGKAVEGRMDVCTLYMYVTTISLERCGVDWGIGGMDDKPCVSGPRCAWVEAPGWPGGRGKRRAARW